MDRGGRGRCYVALIKFGVLGSIVVSGFVSAPKARAMRMQTCTTTSTGYTDASGAVQVVGSYECRTFDIPDRNDPREPRNDQGDSGLNSGGGVTDRRVSRSIQTKEKGCLEEQQLTTSQPVVIATGNKIKPETDFVSGSGDLAFGMMRLYDKAVNKYGIFGSRWTSSIEYSLTFSYGSVTCTGKLSAATSCSPGGATLTKIFAYRASGYALEFTKSSAGTWIDDDGDVLTQSGTNWVLTTRDGDKDTYDSQGRPLSVVDERGVGMSYSYTNNQLTRVTHTSGRTIGLTWNGARISAVTDPAGKTYSYTYSPGWLSQVTYPDGLGTRGYLYEDSAQAGGLTGITINGVRYSKYVYYADGRVKSSGLGSDGSVDRSTFVYGANTVDVTNALGQATHYEIADVAGSKQIIGVERPASGICPAGGKYTAYDANGNVDYKIDALGVKTDYTYDADRRLIQKIVGIGPAGETDQQQITQFVWDAAKKSRLSSVKVFGTSVSMPLSETTYTYYPDGDARARLVASVSIKNKAAVGTLNQTLTTNYNYTIGSNKLVSTQTVDGPILGTGDSITRTYDSAGNLTSVKNSVGHVTALASYTALGQPGKITGPNGDAITYGYDAMGRMILRRTAFNGSAQDYTYTYNSAGNLLSESQPDGQTITYGYQAFNSDWPLYVEMLNGSVAKSKRVQYARNLLGQPTTITILAGKRSLGPGPGPCLPPGCSIPDDGPNPSQPVWTYTTTAQSFMDYDAGGLLQARRGNNGQNIRYAYNANGDLLTTKDSLNNITTLTYNRKRQVIQVRDAMNGLTKYGYDPVGRVIKVIDPRGLFTIYSYDGLGLLWSESSPDTGTTTHEYNAAGLQSKFTRNDGSSTALGYDALGRLTSMTSSGQSTTYSYDTCTNGKGLLCKTTAPPSSQTQWTYTPDGLPATRTETVTGSGVVTNYPTYFYYDNLRRLNSMTYPNGVSVGYGFAGGRATAMTVNIGGTVTNVVSGVTYDPSGSPSGWTYGNGLTQGFSFDTDSRLTAIKVENGTVDVQNLTFAYDANDQVTAITNSINPGTTQNYVYDPLLRLKQSSTGYNDSLTYSFDSNGNRTMVVLGGKSTRTDTYSVNAVSGRLQSISGGRSATFDYDLSGNTISAYGRAFSYNVFNRMVSATTAAGISTYEHNAIGERVRKTVAGDSNYRFVYGSQNQLLAEHRDGGDLWSDYLYFEGTLVGLVRNGQIYYIHNDHLGRPESVTSSSKAKVWYANNYAFERTLPFNTIGGLNLGYPGQYYDSEIAIWHNGYRDYDGTTGRYLQSDPIGLAGGVNTYAYVEGNPVSFIDSLGLSKDYWISPIRDQIIFRGALNDPDRPGIHTIYAHGGPNAVNGSSFFRKYGPSLNAIQAAERIKGSNWNGADPIWLKSCNTGKDPNGFAQQLANELGVTVYAPNSQVWFSTSGVIGPMPRVGGTTGPADYSNPGQYTPFYPMSQVGP